MQSYDAASNATYLDGGAPFFARGTRETALLLLHGFSGCPYEMRWLGDRLAQQGYSVSAPALPGHATYPAALNGVRFEEWTASVAAAVRHLRAEVSPRVGGIGTSMGAMLGLFAAAADPEIAAVGSSSAPFVMPPLTRLGGALARRWPLAWTLPPLLPALLDLADPEEARRFVCYRSFPVHAARELFRLIEAARPCLAEVRQPVLLLHGSLDRIVPAASSSALAALLPNAHGPFWLTRSRHISPVDYDREELLARIVTFLAEQCGEAPRPPAVTQLGARKRSRRALGRRAPAG